MRPSQEEGGRQMIPSCSWPRESDKRNCLGKPPCHLPVQVRRWVFHKGQSGQAKPQPGHASDSVPDPTRPAGSWSWKPLLLACGQRSRS